MRADNSHFLIAAARHRSPTTRKRAVAALRRMEKSGWSITFDAVAREAQVSRSWLYNQTDLRAEIEPFEPADIQPHPTGRSYRIDNAPPTPHSCSG